MSCQGNSSDINQTFIIEPLSLTGGSPSITACTEVITNSVVSCTGDSIILLSSGSTIFNTDIIPTGDTSINIGSPINRFRIINSISGVSSYWTASTSISSAMLDLGIDSSGNTRQITANNSIIQDDILLGGTY